MIKIANPSFSMCLVNNDVPVNLLNTNVHINNHVADDLIGGKMEMNITPDLEDDPDDILWSIRALYDTGAQCSLLSKPAFDKFRRKNPKRILKQLNSNLIAVIRDASGNPIPIVGIFVINFFYHGRSCVGKFVVVEKLNCEAIIGMNLIATLGLNHNPASKYIQFIDQVKDVTDVSACHIAPDDITCAEDYPYLICARKAKVIGPGIGTSAVVYLMNEKTKEHINQPCQFMSLMEPALGGYTQTDEEGNFTIPIQNHHKLLPLNLKRNQIMGRACPHDFYRSTDDAGFVNSVQNSRDPAEAAATARPHTAEEILIIRAKLSKQIDDTVPYPLRAEYLDQLMTRQDAFSADSYDLGFTTVTEHDIQLSDPSPVYRPQFRLAESHLSFIKENVAGWLRAGLVSHTKSRYNAPIFCVPKKGGSGVRCVLDFRALNDKSFPDKYSIRTIDQCLEEIGQAKSSIFSCLDLTNGFWQLKLHEDSRHLTAFTIPGLGQYQWNVTAQGLMGAPASFSRLMDLIMRGASNVITYIDDVLIHSRTHPEHLAHLLAAIDRVRSANLRLNPEKCIFGAAQVQYLGQTISGQGVQPGLDKTSALKDVAPPANVKQLKSFMGLANYFRNFIRRFSIVANPLFDMVKQNADWSNGLTPAALAAFKFIQKTISEKPVLAYPNREGMFHLYVDAALGDSTHAGGLGAFLMQEQPDGGKKVIAFASRRLSKHEKNYPAFLAEVQAAVYGMDYFHHYLVGRRFFLYTDHKPMVPLSTVHTKTLTRLHLKMQEMHPDIRYISGKDNTVADFLSRYEGMNCAVVDCSPFRIEALQREDPQLGPWMTFCDEQNRLAGGTPVQCRPPHCTRNLILDNRILRASITPRHGIISKNDTRILAPDCMRKELVRECHNSLLGGHSGIFKTSERIKTEFWWPGMDADISAHISQCIPCQSTTNKNRVSTSTPLQQLPECTRPNQRIHVDLFGTLKNRDTDSGVGPLKESSRKNRFVMVITDAFTKSVHLKAIPDKTAITVANAILNHMYVFGIPDKIQSDQGLEFCNLLSKELWTRLGIQHDVTAPYHPQCNSAVETFNKTMANYIRTALFDARRSTLDWELYLGPLALSYNTAVHSSTKVTPFYATFGYDPKVPLWQGLHLSDLGDTARSEKLALSKNFTHADHLAKLQRTHLETRDVIYHNNQHTRVATKAAHDKSHKTDVPRFEPDDLVLVRRNKKDCPNPKLAASWEPGQILERLSSSNYKVLRTERSRKKIATLNADLLKPFVHDTAPTYDSDTDAEFDDDPDANDDSQSDMPDDPDNLPPAAVHDMSDSDDSDDDEPIISQQPPSRYNLRSRKGRKATIDLNYVTLETDSKELLYLIENGYELNFSYGPRTAGESKDAPATAENPNPEDSDDEFEDAVEEQVQSPIVKKLAAAKKRLLTQLKKLSDHNKPGALDDPSSSRSRTRAASPYRQASLPPKRKFVQKATSVKSAKSVYKSAKQHIAKKLSPNRKNNTKDSFVISYDSLFE